MIELKTKLYKRSFTAFDSKGCQFKGECYIVRAYKGGPIIEQDYYCMNVHAKSLKELKDKVSLIIR